MNNGLAGGTGRGQDYRKGVKGLFQSDTGHMRVRAVSDGDFLKRSGSSIVGGRASSAAEQLAYGTSGGLTTDYICNCSGGTTLGSAALVINTLFLIPFLVPSDGANLVKISFETTVGAVGNVRLGVCRSTGTHALYPTTVVYDSGDISAAGVGEKSAVPALTVSGGRYYAMIVGAVAPTIRAVPIANCTGLLGYVPGTSTAPVWGLTGAFAYGALGSTAPAGLTQITGTVFPAIRIQFA